MLALALSHIMLHCFFRYHADSSMKVSCAPKFITPELVNKKCTMTFSHFSAAVTLKKEIAHHWSDQVAAARELPAATTGGMLV